MFRLVISLMVVLVLAGCGVTRPAIEQTRTVTVTEVERDSTVNLQPDEAWLRAWLECDSLNMVVIREIEQKDGELIKLSYALKKAQESIADDAGQTLPQKNKQAQQLFFTAEIDSQAVYIAWKEKHVHEQEIKTLVVYKKPKEPPWWYSAIIVICVTIIVTTIIMFVKRFIK